MLTIFQIHVGKLLKHFSDSLNCSFVFYMEDQRFHKLENISTHQHTMNCVH